MFQNSSNTSKSQVLLQIVKYYFKMSSQVENSSSSTSRKTKTGPKAAKQNSSTNCNPFFGNFFI